MDVLTTGSWRQNDEGNPELNFDGNCREAFRYYAEVLGGELHDMMSYGDSPIAGEVSEDWHDRIMHAYLTVDDVVLMGSDIPPGAEHRPGGIQLSRKGDEALGGARVAADAGKAVGEDAAAEIGA